MRLIHFCPGCVFDACSLILNPASFDPVNAMNRVFGFVTSASPAVPPGPVKKLTTSRGTPASNKISMKMAAIVGESLDGFTIAVFPATIAAAVMPPIIAAAKFHGGIITPTPSGMYFM